MYRRLVEDHRQAARQFAAIAGQMAGSRDLPMGRHDEAALASPAVQDSFQRFVHLEQELLTILQRRLARDQQMLGSMGDGAGS